MKPSPIGLLGVWLSILNIIFRVYAFYTSFPTQLASKIVINHLRDNLLRKGNIFTYGVALRKK